MVYCGGRLLGVNVLSWLCKQENVCIKAICPIEKKYDEQHYTAMIDLAAKYKIKLCDINQFPEADYGLSVNYNRIINSEALFRCKNGFFNVHHSYNLRLRGRNISTHAILNTLHEKIYYHGTCIHRMVPALDAGPIVASVSFPIAPDDTAYSLFCKADRFALELIKDWWPRILWQTVFPYMPSEEGIHIYKNSELPSRIIETANLDEIDALIRAFDFPGKEPAYILKNGEKTHLVYHRRDNYQNEIQIGEKTFFTDV